MGVLSFNKKMLASTILLFLFSSLSEVAAQGTFSFLPGSASTTFPDCALSCTVLLQAQAACVPPQAAITNDRTYISCFCQSAFLTSLPYSGALCNNCASASDQQLLANWYKGYCAGGYTSTVNTAAPTAVTSSSSTTTASATSTAAASGDVSTANTTPTWFQTHWRWVVMLIVLVVVFSALAAVGVWYKKRMDAKHPGLYHGNDSNNASTPGSRGGPGMMGFFAGDPSKSNVVSTTNPSAVNSSNNVAAVGPTLAKSQQQQPQHQPSMSMTSFSNRRASLLGSFGNNNNNATINNNVHNNQMWGPNQARDLDDILPVEEPVFRNSMAAAAAAAAYEKSVGTTSTATPATNDSSSVGTGKGAGGAEGKAENTAANTPSPLRNLNRISAQSASNLHQQSQSQQNFSRVLQRPKSASPMSSSNQI